jgi:hypothetical protein
LKPPNARRYSYDSPVLPKEWISDFQGPTEHVIGRRAKRAEGLSNAIRVFHSTDATLGSESCARKIRKQSAARNAEQIRASEKTGDGPLECRQSGTARHPNRRIDFFQGRSGLRLAGLLQFFLSVDPLLRLVGRLNHYFPIPRASEEQNAGDGAEEKTLGFHYL